MWPIKHKLMNKKFIIEFQRISNTNMETTSQKIFSSPGQSVTWSSVFRSLFVCLFVVIVFFSFSEKPKRLFTISYRGKYAKEVFSKKKIVADLLLPLLTTYLPLAPAPPPPPSPTHSLLAKRRGRSSRCCGLVFVRIFRVHSNWP